MKRVTLLLTASALFALNTLTQAQVVTDYNGDSTLLNPSRWTVEPTAAFPLVIDENFQNWTANHDKANTDSATKGRAAIEAYRTRNQTINLVGPLSGTTAEISLVKCAVAPQGLSQNKIEFTKPKGDIFEGKPSNYTNGQIPDPEGGIPLSPGFLEVSRFTSNGTQYVTVTDDNGNEIKSTLADEETYNGSITLPPIKGATVVQYSYSSLGGNKRGLKLERSIDGGVTWEVIRNPLKNVVEYAVKDTVNKVTYPSGADDTPTEYSRYISAYFCSGAGVRVEDFIGDGEETVTLRFTICNAWGTAEDRAVGDLTKVGTQQDFRLHDLRVIAKSEGGTTSGDTWKAPLGTEAGDIISLAKGEILPTGIDGLQVTHNFTDPVLNRSDADAPAVTYNGVTYDNKSIVQASNTDGQNFIFSPSKNGTLDVCGKMGSGKGTFIFETETPVETLVTYTAKNGGEITDKTAPTVTAVGLKADGTPMDEIPAQSWNATAAINTTGGNAWVVMSFPVTAGKNYVVGVDGSKFMLVGIHFSGPTGIDRPFDKTPKTLVIGLKGQLEIRNSENTVTVFNITGQKVATIRPNSGSSIIPVPQGIYIVAEKNQKTIKALVK